MEQFYYRAVSGTGKVTEKTVTSESADILRRELESQGLHLFTLQKKGFLSISEITFFDSVSAGTMLVFNQELLVMLSAGLPVMEVFEILYERVEGDYFRRAIAKIIDDIKSGESMSDAMLKHPDIFSELYVFSLKAGERSGNLTDVIKRYIAYQKTVIGLKKKILSALTYPTAILFLSIAVVTYLITFVLPTFSQIYVDSNSELPFITRLLLNFTGTILKYYWMILVFLPPLLLFLWRFYNSRAGRLLGDAWIMSLPLVGKLVVSENLVRISRTLATILKSGIPLLNSIQILAESTSNQVLKDRLFRVADKISEGVMVVTAFKELEIIPKISLEMLDVGAKTGSLEQMLGNIADFHEDELDLYLDRITTWIEPLLLLVTGVLVAFIVAAIYLPIFNLAGTIG